MSENNNDISARIRDFISSAAFEQLPEESLSDYWRHYHETIKFSFGETVSVHGESGIYMPQPPRSNLQKLGSLIRSPRNYARIITRRALRGMMVRAGMLFDLKEVPIKAAFDAIMSGHQETKSAASPPFIDFTAVASSPGTFADSGVLARDYLSHSNGIPPNNYVFQAYFYLNILKYFNVLKTPFTFLEIGAGNGNFAAQMLRHRQGTCFIVDLPRTLVGSISFLTKFYPDMSVILPHEATASNIGTADLVFLTPAQIELVPSTSCNLAVNTHSFQEMTTAQISVYFNLIGRVLVDGGHFFSVNRVEKCAAGYKASDTGHIPEIIRAAEYPWNPDWIDRAYQICPMGRMLGRDNWHLRLTQKPK